MSGRQPLIIDDVNAALARMSALGRECVEESALRVRDVVLDFAAKRGWSIVPYERYSRWARELVAGSDGAWIVLDPLLPLEGLRADVLPLRASRIGAEGRPCSEAEWPVAGHSVSILDDAAASGATLRDVARKLTDVGTNLCRVATCASSHLAHAALQPLAPRATWTDFVPGDWAVAHLRDCCPHLPFSARPTGERNSLGDVIGNVEPRIPMTEVAGSLWQSLNVASTVHCAILEARGLTVARLGERLGRPALVADLGALGPSVPALTQPGVHPTSETVLASLVPNDKGAGAS